MPPDPNRPINEVFKRLGLRTPPPQVEFPAEPAENHSVIWSLAKRATLAGGIFVGFRAIKGWRPGVQFLAGIGAGLKRVSGFKNVLANVTGANIPLASDIKNLGIARDIREIISTVGPLTSQSARVSFMGSPTGRAISQRLSRGPRGVPGLESLRVKDILSGGRGMPTLNLEDRRALEAGLRAGLVRETTPLGAGLYRSGNRALDIRWASAGDFARRILNTPIKVPIVNFPIANIFRPLVSLFGNKGGVRRVKPGTQLPGIGTIRHGGLLVGSDLHLLGPRGTMDLYARGVHLLERNETAAFNAAAAYYGARYYRHDVRNRGFFGRLQQRLGIGPEYATGRSIISKLAIDPFRRLFSGTIGLKRQIKAKDATDSIVRGINLDLEGKTEELVPNIYRRVSDIPGGRLAWDKIRAAFGGGKYVEYNRPGRLERLVPGPNKARAFPNTGDQVLIPNRDRAGITAGWLGGRITDLTSWTTGMGYRPGFGKLGFLTSAARIGGIFAAGWATLNAANYADYQLESVTGVSPKKAAAFVYTRARLAQTALREGLGITQGARYLEDLMPLSMTSTASGIIRAIAPPLILGTKYGRTGLLAGVGISGLIGGLPESAFYPEGILKGYDELRKEYAGELKIPVRKNRWWELSPDEFTGGEIKYFKPSWYAELTSGYQNTAVRYGEESNFWKKVSMFPTPSNWFGLRPTIDPGWLAEQQAIRRPYPVIPGSLLVSPQRRSMIVPSTRPSLGLPELLNRVEETQEDLQTAVSNTFERVTEFLGIYKFLAETALNIKTPLKQQFALASASEMTSIHREFWDSGYGGLGGMTELLRRFILPRDTQPNLINPLPNEIPEWVPGSRSIYPEDTTSFFDFHLGDPFTKIPHGEYRLPGPGYEALYPLHSRTTGIYDPVDRYLILSDIAPYSAARREYKTIVDSWISAGVVDKEWMERINQAEVEVQARQKGARTLEKRFTPGETGLKQRLEALAYSSMESSVGKLWEFLTHEVVAGVPYIGSKFLQARTAFEEYKESEVYGETYRKWDQPLDSFIYPMMRQAVAEDPFSGTMRGALLGMMGTTAYSKVILGLAGGAIGGGGSTIRAMSTGKMSGGWVPEEKRREWELEEYFDALKYVRAKRMQGMALQAGNITEAALYAKEAERTITGLPKEASIGQIQAALPNRLKPYFRTLLESPVEQQGDILGLVPEYVRPAFQQIWGLENYKYDPEAAAAEYFARNKLPDEGSLAWHPQIPFDAIKIRFVESGANSTAGKLHHFGLYSGKMSGVPFAYSSFEAPNITLNNPSFSDLETRENLFREFAQISIVGGAQPNPMGMNTIRMTRDRSERLANRIKYGY